MCCLFSTILQTPCPNSYTTSMILFMLCISNMLFDPFIFLCSNCQSYCNLLKFLPTYCSNQHFSPTVFLTNSSHSHRDPLPLRLRWSTASAGAPCSWSRPKRPAAPSAPRSPGCGAAPQRRGEPHRAERRSPWVFAVNDLKNICRDPPFSMVGNSASMFLFVCLYYWNLVGSRTVLPTYWSKITMKR